MNRKQNTQLQGFNQTHFINHITDNEALVIDSLVDKIKNINPEKRQVIRWPGGTEANFYNCTMSGYSVQEEDSKYARNGVNAFDIFIDVSKDIQWQVIPVLNLYEEYKNPSLASDRQYQNMLMIEKLVAAGIEIPYIELGNELNIWIEGVKHSDYNRNKTGYDREIKKYYDISLRYYNLIKSKYPDIKVAAVYCEDNNGRDKQWQRVFSQGPWEGLIVHVYEDKPESQWESHIQEIVNDCNKVGKECLITEWAWKLGPSPLSLAYKINSSSPLLPKYHEIGWELMQRNNVAVSCFHRISGINGHPYNYVQF